MAKGVGTQNAVWCMRGPMPLVKATSWITTAMKTARMEYVW